MNPDLVVNEEEEEDGAKKKERDLALVLFIPVFVSLIDVHTGTITDELAKGRITPQAWAEGTEEVLKGAHATAYGMGLLKAGVVPTDPVQVAAAEAKWQEQSLFFDRFRTEVADGRYTDPWGNLRTEAVEDRLHQYAMGVRATANEGWRDGLPDTTLFRWLLGNKEHCTPRPTFDYTCVDLNQRGWMTKEQLPTVPGACKTPCLFHCDCRLVTSEGEEGF
jgi:hypothetical protein